MLYKVYNELPGVGTAAIPLISVILYNACNVMEWGTIQHVKAHTARTSTGRSGALPDALGGVRCPRWWTIRRGRWCPYKRIQHEQAKKRAAN